MAGRRAPDITGHRFGRLTVISPVPRVHGMHGTTRWLCSCDCGTETVVAGGLLRSGNTQSCGCLRRDVTTARNTTHGLSNTPTYDSWKAMIQRTTNRKWARWADYGGRGITVCERWLDYEAFLADMGERPPGLTLDRFPDNDGNYEPGNCRWATLKQQQANRRISKA